MDSDLNDPVRQLAYELANFEEIARYLTPQRQDMPSLEGMDIFGGSLALNGSVGGDHLIFIDFKKRFDLEARIAHCTREGRLDVVENLKRCQHTAAVALLDVSGHRVTDAFIAAMLHQAFLLGAIYELDMFGRVTKRLFENLNTRFYESSSDHKFVSLIYGEIGEDASFRFLSAAQPFPVVFSQQYDRIVDTRPELWPSYPPLGMLPSRHMTDRSQTASVLGFKDDYTMNRWVLEGAGDILLLHTDGLVDHHNGGDYYYPGLLEQKLRSVKHQTAEEIFIAITTDLLTFSTPSDDISLVVIKAR
jgi:serine phosphatase RsbU (regulator of sigma subunit)